MEPYDIDRILIEIPAGKKLTLLIRSDTAHQISYGQASGGNIEGWMPAGQSIGFDVDCETLQRFYFIASTAAAARKSLVYDALVEDSDECAEQVPEVIDSIDSCLIGTWKLNMDAHLGEIKITDPTVREQTSDIDGSLALEFRPDKTLEVSITGYEEIHDFGDSIRGIRIQSKGKGKEEWGADGKQLNAIGIPNSWSYETTFDDPLGGSRTLTAPPVHLLFLPDYQTYFCTVNALTVFFADGFNTNWTR